jgi:hypothetical protein
VQDIYDEWVLLVCELWPALTPWGVWESLEWRLFEQLVTEAQRRIKEVPSNG